jgi:AcrR family transcriptional regulator
MLVRDAQQSSKEDPRILRTRKLLTQALNELLREKSFQSITVGEITDRATLNRVTFYAHFEDKFALLEYSVREMIREQIAQEIPDAHSYSEETLRGVLKLVAHFITEMNKHCPPPQGQMQPVMEKQIKAELYDMVHAWMASRRGRRGAPTAEQTAMVTSWAIYGAAMQWSQQNESSNIDDFVAQVLPLITTNLQTLTSELQERRLHKATGGTAGFGLTRPAYALI